MLARPSSYARSSARPCAFTARSIIPQTKALPQSRTPVCTPNVAKPPLNFQRFYAQQQEGGSQMNEKRAPGDIDFSLRDVKEHNVPQYGSGRIPGQYDHSGGLDKFTITEELHPVGGGAHAAGEIPMPRHSPKQNLSEEESKPITPEIQPPKYSDRDTAPQKGTKGLYENINPKQ